MQERVNILFTQRGARKVSGDIATMGKSAGLAGKATAALKSQLLLLGAGLTLGAGIKVMSDFGQEMATVKAITGATLTQFNALRESAKLLGAETRFSGRQAAEGMKYLARAGFNTRQVLDSIAGTLQLAQAGALDLGRAADISSNILKGFNLEAKEMGRVVDVLALTANSANTDIEQLGEAMKFAAPVAAGLGVSMEETAAAVGVLSDAGLQGTLAGTGLRLMLAKLTAVTPNGAKALDKLGLAVKEVNPRIVGFTGAIENLVKHGATIEDMFEIFDIRGGPAAQVLASSVEHITELRTALNNADGAGKAFAETMDDTLQGSMFRALSAVQDLAISLGDLGVYDFLKESFDLFATSLLKVSKNLKEVAKVFAVMSPALLLIASGGAISFFTSLAGAVSALGVAVGGIGLATLLLNPVTLLAGLIGTAIAAMVVFRKEIKVFGSEYENLEDVFTVVMESSTETFDVWKQGANDTYNAMSDLIVTLDDAITKFPRLKSAMDSAFEFAKKKRDNFFKFPDVPKVLDDLINSISFGATNITVFQDVGDQLVKAFKKSVNSAAMQRVSEEFGSLYLVKDWQIEQNEKKILAGLDRLKKSFLQKQGSAFADFGIKETTTKDPFDGLHGYVSKRLGKEEVGVLIKEQKLLAEVAKELTRVKQNSVMVDQDVNEMRSRGLTITKEEVLELKKFTNLANNIDGVREALGKLGAQQTQLKLGEGFRRYATAVQEIKAMNVNLDRQLEMNAALNQEQRDGLELEYIKQDLVTSGLGAEYEGFALMEKKFELLRKQNNSLKGGWTLALNDYTNNLNEVGLATAGVFDNVFQGMEDALVEFVRSGKLNFRSLIDSMISDLIRLAIQQSIMKFATNFLGGLGGGGGATSVATSGGSVLGGDPNGVIPMAKGGLITRPTLFATGGGVALAGEAGTEVIMPASRMANGDMGVNVSGMSRGGGQTVFAPHVEVNVQGGGGGQEGGAEQGKMIAKELNRALEQKFIEFTRQVTRPGGQLNRMESF